MFQRSPDMRKLEERRERKRRLSSASRIVFFSSEKKDPKTLAPQTSELFSPLCLKPQPSRVVFFFTLRDCIVKIKTFCFSAFLLSFQVARSNCLRESFLLFFFVHVRKKRQRERNRERHVYADSSLCLSASVPKLLSLSVERGYLCGFHLSVCICVYLSVVYLSVCIFVCLTIGDQMLCGPA